MLINAAKLPRHARCNHASCLHSCNYASHAAQICAKAAEDARLLSNVSELDIVPEMGGRAMEESWERVMGTKLDNGKRKCGV